MDGRYPCPALPVSGASRVPGRCLVGREPPALPCGGAGAVHGYCTKLSLPYSALPR
jgi:hypothetical protein